MYTESGLLLQCRQICMPTARPEAPQALEHLAFYSQDDKAWLFGKTALLLFTFAEAGQTA
jgi:hypothetical protein